MADSNKSGDIRDSNRDAKRLEPEETTIGLPDVGDIPGQENIHVPNLREMADTTIASDDEEGTGIWQSGVTEDLSNDNTGPAQQVTENDLTMESSTKKLESVLDKEDATNTNTETDLDITDDSVSADSDVTPEEKTMLEQSSLNMDTLDNENLMRAELDDTDFEGERLNEKIEVTGDDLDVPGTELDDDNENIGEEDEENNAYSLGDNE